MFGLPSLRRAAIASVIGAFALSGPAAAEPLKTKENIKGLYQRVVTKPAARILKAPGGAVVGQPNAFATYYVFESKKQAGVDWVSIGPNAAGAPLGWVSSADYVRLDHLLVLCPTRRGIRERAIFFKDAASLGKAASDSARVENYRKLLTQAKGDNAPAAAGAVGIEPTNVADCIDAFAFMPIRQVQEKAAISGIGNSRFFQTLSVPLPAKPPQNEDFRQGVVFVIDTSKSMGPYIEQVRKSVARLSADMRNTPAGKNLSFGVVAFRDSTKAQATSEYVTKLIHPLETQFRPAAFDAAVKGMKESSVSNADFREDAVAGMAEALKMDAWDKFQVRTVILVTDAGMRDGNDPMSETSLATSVVAAEMRTKGIAGLSVFLKTEAGKAEHASALSQHRAITRSDNVRDRVIQVTGGSVPEFAKGIEEAMTRAGKALDMNVQDLQASVAKCSGNAQLPEIERVLCGLDANTLAMRIEWLGRRRGATPPSVVDGWVSDVSLDSTRAADMMLAYKPFLLLTRNQMNDLRVALKPLSTVTKTDIDSNREKVIQIFQEAVARGAVDPTSLKGSTPLGGRIRVADAQTMDSLLPRYLAVLPLKSPVMNLTVAKWINPQGRADDIDRIDTALFMLDRWIDQKRGWIKLTPGAPDHEDVYAVPWEMVP